MNASSPFVAVIGGGPAGLMAAEVLAQGGARVELFDAMPSVGRKFLLAGVGGMNITHSEAKTAFVGRYGARCNEVGALLEEFGADALCAWIHGLGIDTFVGTSGRVFPTDMKAAPLLRAWLKRLREQGVLIHTRSRWSGWAEDGALRIATPAAETHVRADACVLALGGGSWARLGSDGAWVPLLEQRGVTIAPLQPSNCGFEVAGWSPLLREKFAGAPIKSTAIRLDDQAPRLGEFVLTDNGSTPPAAPPCTWTFCPTTLWTRSPGPWRAHAVHAPWPSTCIANWASTVPAPACCGSCRPRTISSTPRAWPP